MVDWSMYTEIQNLKKKKFKKAQAARQLSLNRETVAKYWDMPPDVYAAKKVPKRSRKADIYRDFIVEQLMAYPDITAAQLYDWCKERSSLETLSFQKRSFQDYVNDLRKEYDIKKPENGRQYEAVDERAPGEQAQVDMGEIYVQTLSGRRKKIYCFAMVLAHSRYKYVEWHTRPFTTDSFIRCHVHAFSYFGGRPKEVVYDQDKVLAVSENDGDIIYTAGFQSYADEVKFRIYLCRGADPESKGMIENVVKFAKHGFAEHRTMTDIESFNDDCLAWLQRTANHDVHGTTHKRPDEVFALEQEYLIPVSEYSFESAVNDSISYTVRKDNVVLYKGNRYRVPVGTYHKGVRVFMIIDDLADTVTITDMITGEIYATHPLCHEKGKLIGRSERSERDRSKTVLQQEQTLMELFKNHELVSPFLEHIHQEKPRYYRDQLGIIKQLFEEWNKDEILRGMQYCSEREIYSANELKSSIIYLSQEMMDKHTAKTRDGTGGTGLPAKYRGDRPEVRPLSTYEEAMKERGVVNE
ncbi:MAG: IS21 family transposase [Eubacteriales bacterium]|nr:IS21 family transposase [Eubacteriales bacterium]